MNLTIVQDQKASGVYTCTIKDKNDILQSVYTGIYSSVQEVEREGQSQNNIISNSLNMAEIMITF